MENKLLITQKPEILEAAAKAGANLAGLKYVDLCLVDPSRRTGISALKSFPSDYASLLSGVTIQAESVTVELKHLLLKQMDPNIRISLDQPERIIVSGISPKGRRTRFPYTPDYLDIGVDRVTAVECKTRQKLERLVVNRPNDYLFLEGQFRFRPAEAYFERLGVNFRIFVDDEVGDTALANLMLLAPMQERALANGEATAIRRIGDMVRERPLTVEQVRRAGIAQADLMIAIGLANHLLYGCLHAIRVTDAKKFHVFADPGKAAALDRKLLAAQLDTEQERESIWRESAATFRASNLRRANARLKRQEQIDLGLLEGNSNDRKIAKLLREQIAAGEEPVKAATGHYESSGNPGSRVEAQTPLMQTMYDKHIATTSPWSMRFAHNTLCPQLAAAGFELVSYETFRKFVNAKNSQATALAQSGARGWQAGLPITGSKTKRPLALTAGQIVHVDSSLEDGRQFASIAGRIRLERPAIALAVCERTQLLLGMAVAFGSASRFLLALLRRDIIRRWGFFPPWIVNDGGPEHRANMWKDGLAWKRTSIIRRPTAGSRAGKCVEDAVRQVNYGFVRKLTGSTRNDEASRRASNSTKSRATAIHDFQILQSELRDYVEKALPEMPKGIAHASPGAWFAAERLLLPVGVKGNINDPITLIETAVPIAVRKRDLDPTRGLRVGLRNYSSVELIDAAKRNGTFDEVRLDPEDPSTIYVYFADGWVRADSNDARQLRELDPLELLVEGMHAPVRHFENAAVRNEFDAKLANKVDELEAAAIARKARATASVFGDAPAPAQPAPSTSDERFARAAATPKEFATREK